MDVKRYLSITAYAVEERAKSLIKRSERIYPLLKKAMLYSLNAPGKRIRPALMFASYSLKGNDFRKILDAGCAIEMLHTYSLIHDDLPAMDDSDLRRGKLTNHKIYGEGIAILAGDALLTDAFYHVLEGNKRIDIAFRAKAAGILAYRAGSNGMVSGQSADLDYENFSSKGFSKKRLSSMLDYIHSRKTSDLIIAACQMGCVLSGDSENFSNITCFAENLGLCFQITDDILDATADKKKIGKFASDAKNRKLTFVSLFGLEKSKEMAELSWEMAFSAMKRLKGRKDVISTLDSIARFILGRGR